MPSTRARLTISYAFVLLGTMVAFGVALAIGRSKEALQLQLGQEAFRVADNVLYTIQSAQLASKRLTFVDSTSGPTQVIKSTKELADVLDPLPGYFMVLDQGGKLLYSSGLMRLLSGDDQTALLRSVLQLVDETGGVIVPVRGDSLHLLEVTRRNVLVGGNISRVVAALPTNLAELPTTLLVGTMIVVAPIIFIVSMVVAYLVVGSAFQPVDQLINEVEAITDGRSLHRRLPADTSNDELSRLSLTVNAMLTRLEGSFAGLRRFTADASHELKTPLTVLRADEGRFDIHRTPVELEPLVREVYETAVILGEDAGLTLSLSALENGIVMGDRTRLRQLLLNLITNAIKYTPRGGHVELAVTHKPTDEVAIAVRDTGIGISAADQPHIFDLFWRADRARSRASERGGFGLGLSIAQWIVQAHGGSINVQSRLGRGTVFTVLLPILPGEPAQAASKSQIEETVESAES